MAKEAPKKEEAAAPAAPPAKSSKKLIILIVLVVVILAVAGAGVVLLMKKKAKAAEGEEAVAEETAHEEAQFDPKKPPVFVPMEPFTVNLQAEAGEQFLQVVATMRVADDKIGEQIKVFMPQIRHEVLSLLAGKKASEITTPEGREGLAEEIRGLVNDVLGWEPPKKKKKAEGSHGNDGAPVVGVFFTQFIVQ